MEFDVLQKKSSEELRVLLAEAREALRKARFSASQKQLKNIRGIRDHKKMIARILTIVQGASSRTA